MDIFNQAFLEVMAQGDAKGRPFTFPIPTYNITKDFDGCRKNKSRNKTKGVGRTYGQESLSVSKEIHSMLKQEGIVTRRDERICRAEAYTG